VEEGRSAGLAAGLGRRGRQEVAGWATRKRREREVGPNEEGKGRIEFSFYELYVLRNLKEIQKGFEVNSKRRFRRVQVGKEIWEKT
jgi:hypothetical protein